MSELELIKLGWLEYVVVKENSLTSSGFLFCNALRRHSWPDSGYDSSEA